MKKLLLSFFFSTFALIALAGVKSFPLDTPIEEVVIACKEQQAAEVISTLSAQNRLDELGAIGTKLFEQRICVFGHGTVTYVRQVLRIEVSDGLFTVYEAKVEGVPFPVFVPMKDYEHASS